MQSNYNPFKVKTGDPARDAHLKRQFIRGFPFPHKMWVIVNAGNYEFLRWNRDGTAILLNFVALNDYLNSPRSIFNTKSRAEFLKNLDEFQFERLDAAPEAGNGIIFQYKNEDFQRHRYDLLGKVRRRTDQASGETSEKDKSVPVNAAKAAEQLLSSKKAERVRGDPCFMKFGTLSSAEKSRILLEATLKFENTKRQLQEHLKSHNQNTTGQGRGVAQTLANDESFVEMFENPLDSVFERSEESHPDYTGYYGNCSEDQLKKFFGDYLPQKQEGLSAHNSDMMSKQEETPQQLLCSGDGPYTLTLPPLMLSPRQQTSPNLNLRDYAGPYGNFASSEERIKKFFADYLPQKQEGLSAHNSDMMSKQEETPQQLLCSGDGPYTLTLPPLMLSPRQQTSPILNLRDYAGPYGNCTSSEERIKKFFADLLHQNQEGLSAHNSDMSSKQEETPQQVLFCGDLDYEPTPPPVMLSPLQQTSPNINFPLKLEPILKTAEEADTDYANNVHSDTQASGGDIEMDEYTQLMPFDENDNDPDHVNADVPIKPSMEQEPDLENEAFTSCLDGLDLLFESDQE